MINARLVPLTVTMPEAERVNGFLQANPSYSMVNNVTGVDGFSRKEICLTDGNLYQCFLDTMHFAVCLGLKYYKTTIENMYPISMDQLSCMDYYSIDDKVPDDFVIENDASNNLVGIWYLNREYSNKYKKEYAIMAKLGNNVDPTKFKYILRINDIYYLNTNNEQSMYTTKKDINLVGRIIQNYDGDAVLFNTIDEAYAVAVNLVLYNAKMGYSYCYTIFKVFEGVDYDAEGNKEA